MEFKQAIARLANGERLSSFDSDRDWSNRHDVAWQIDVYGITLATYGILRNYVRHPEPQVVIDSLERAGLLGMGGAGGRTYLKWQDVRQARGASKTVICNADESEPGSFKDRDLMLRACAALDCRRHDLGGLGGRCTTRFHSGAT